MEGTLGIFTILFLLFSLIFIFSAVCNIAYTKSTDKDLDPTCIVFILLGVIYLGLGVLNVDADLAVERELASPKPLSEKAAKALGTTSYKPTKKDALSK